MINDRIKSYVIIKLQDRTKLKKYEEYQLDDYDKLLNKARASFLKLNQIFTALRNSGIIIINVNGQKQRIDRVI